jgi:hypothetical protein
MKEIRNIKIAMALGVGLATAVPFALNATTSPNNTTVERKQTTTVERDDDDFDLGWLGLLGLGGLAGLLGKRDHTHRERNPDGTYR